LQGKPVLIVQALYGLKSSGAAWWAYLVNTLFTIGFTLCLADPDIWYRVITKSDGFHYYEYVLVYADDVLALSHDGKSIMKALAEFYCLKDGYGTRYLRAKRRMVFPWR
jgi:hypothetical protein